MSHNLFLLGCRVIIFYAQKNTSVNALNDIRTSCFLWWRAPIMEWSNVWSDVLSSPNFSKTENNLSLNNLEVIGLVYMILFFINLFNMVFHNLLGLIRFTFIRYIYAYTDTSYNAIRSILIWPLWVEVAKSAQSA